VNGIFLMWRFGVVGAFDVCCLFFGLCNIDGGSIDGEQLCV